MSSSRLAKVVKRFVRYLVVSFAWQVERDGPPCSCDGCQRAWWDNQTPRRTARPFTKVNPG